MKHNKLFVPVFAVIDLKDAEIKIQDGSGTPNELIVGVGDGNLTFNESRTIEYMLDRGVLDEVREGDEVPLDVSLEFRWEYIEGTGSSPTPVDAIKQAGAASSWVSSDASGDTCRPYACNIIIDRDLSGCEADSETVTLTDFRWESCDYDAKSGSISVSGKCNITDADIVRTVYT